MEESKKRIYSKIGEKLKSAKNVCVISHRSPDGDTVGSAIALYDIITTSFESRVDLFCIDDLPEKLKFLPHTDKYTTLFSPSDYELFIFVDCSSRFQTSFLDSFPEIFDKDRYSTLVIDHHISNELFGRQNIVLSEYTSTTMVIYELFKYIGVSISPEAALGLLMGIYTDSGGLQHPNTKSLTLKYVSELVSICGCLHQIIDNYFKNNKLNTLKLWGKIIKNSFITKDNVLYSYVNQSDLDAYSCSFDDINGAVNYLNVIDEVNYTMLLTQKGDYIKASLRTLRDDVDLSKLASTYGGGGHKRASGFTKAGYIEEQRLINL